MFPPLTQYVLLAWCFFFQRCTRFEGKRCGKLTFLPFCCFDKHMASADIMCQCDGPDLISAAPNPKISNFPYLLRFSAVIRVVVIA